MECKPSFDVDDVTYLEEQCHILVGPEPQEDNLNLERKSDLGNIIFSSFEAPSPSGTEIKLCPNNITKRRAFSDNPHLLKVPFVEHDDGDIRPYRFDRHAPGRISTSPTLRRLRNSTSSVSQVFQLQDSIENERMHSQLPQTDFSLLPCQSHTPCSQHCSSTSDSGIHTDSLSLRENTTLVDSLSVLPHHKDHLVGDQTLQNTSEIDPSFLTERKQNSQECIEELYLHKPNSLHNSSERRHSSVVVSLPGLEMFPGDLLISDSAAEFLYHSASLHSSESKKPWWPFVKKGMSKDKQKQISDLENCLSTVTIKISECSGYEFHGVKNKTWHEIMKMHQLEPKVSEDQLDTKKKEAVWELFTTECTYFLDHLLVLKMIFMDTLRYLQSKEFLPDVDTGLLFANLEELKQVSLSFVTSFFSAIKDHLVKPLSSIDFIPVLTKYFQGNLCQSHQIYCLNYTSAIFYLEKLKKREDFGIYLKWCEQNEQCKRLHLSELLVAPLHKLTRNPLLLKNIWKNTEAAEKAAIGTIKEKVEKSIRDLEGKVKWLDNFQKFKQLQEIIIWPSLWDQDKRFFVPECLKNILRDNPNENILSPTKRLLIHEGRLTLAEHMRLADVHLFLFDDLLLITKPNRHKKKSGASDLSLIPVCPFFTPEFQSLLEEGGYCIVLDQPIPFDRLIVKNIDSFHLTAFGVRNAFLIQHKSRYQQCIAAFLLQAQTESVKKTWMSQMEMAISNYAKKHNPPKTSFFSLPAESSEI
ncbi:pleckstrin homology domain-containing family G member 7 [Rhineura floridana]|uniref:pleckstrin homology domain-containing family G member 7 n=1 Tax=Rhineura floridana TaxID=261503 RepID=UPI002AC83D08|nr:pleckstrin homology domain-containing family G member 7 [Rhineura floridana]